MAKKNRKKRIEKKTTIIDLIPYIFIVAVVPLIVYLHIDQLGSIEAANWKGGDQYPDLLSYWKSQWFIIASALSLCLFIIRNIQGRIQLRRKITVHACCRIYIIHYIIYCHIKIFFCGVNRVCGKI